MIELKKKRKIKKYYHFSNKSEHLSPQRAYTGLTFIESICHTSFIYLSMLTLSPNVYSCLVTLNSALATLYLADGGVSGRFAVVVFRYIDDFSAFIFVSFFKDFFPFFLLSNCRLYAIYQNHICKESFRMCGKNLPKTK